MESPVSEPVVIVHRKEPWIDAVFATLCSNDRGVSDEDIYQVVNTDADGEAAAELFAAKGVTVPMYCLWKAKYRNLSLDDIRDMRRRDVQRARRAVALLIAVAVLGVGGVALAVGLVARPGIAVVAIAQLDSDIPSAAEAVAPPTPEAVPSTVNDPSPPTVATTPVFSNVSDSGYRIQVAAANTLQEGRVLVERLSSAGYPAYLLPANVNGAQVFRVRVGPFERVESAQDIAAQLKREGYIGAWIAR